MKYILGMLTLMIFLNGCSVYPAKKDIYQHYQKINNVFLLIKRDKANKEIMIGNAFLYRSQLITANHVIMDQNNTDNGVFMIKEISEKKIFYYSIEKFVTVNAEMDLAVIKSKMFEDAIKKGGITSFVNEFERLDSSNLYNDFQGIYYLNDNMVFSPVITTMEVKPYIQGSYLFLSDLYVGPGSSGGPVFSYNKDGNTKLIGMILSIFKEKDSEKLHINMGRMLSGETVDRLLQGYLDNISLKHDINITDVLPMDKARGF